MLCLPKKSFEPQKSDETKGTELFQKIHFLDSTLGKRTAHKEGQGSN